MKKKTKGIKRLITSVCAMTIAAVGAATSTYAWFTMNAAPKIGEFRVQATTLSGMEIALDDRGFASYHDQLNMATDTFADLDYKSVITGAEIEEYLQKRYASTAPHEFFLAPSQGHKASGSPLYAAGNTIIGKDFSDLLGHNADRDGVISDADAGYAADDRAFIEIPLYFRVPADAAEAAASSVVLDVADYSGNGAGDYRSYVKDVGTVNSFRLPTQWTGTDIQTVTNNNVINVDNNGIFNKYILLDGTTIVGINMLAYRGAQPTYFNGTVDITVPYNIYTDPATGDLLTYLPYSMFDEQDISGQITLVDSSWSAGNIKEINDSIDHFVNLTTGNVILNVWEYKYDSTETVFENSEDKDFLISSTRSITINDADIADTQNSVDAVLNGLIGQAYDDLATTYISERVATVGEAEEGLSVIEGPVEVYGVTANAIRMSFTAADKGNLTTLTNGKTIQEVYQIAPELFAELSAVLSTPGDSNTDYFIGDGSTGTSGKYYYYIDDSGNDPTSIPSNLANAIKGLGEYGAFNRRYTSADTSAIVWNPNASNGNYNVDEASGNFALHMLLAIEGLDMVAYNGFGNMITYFEDYIDLHKDTSEIESEALAEFDYVTGAYTGADRAHADYFYASTTVRIWIDGWDAECFNSIMATQAKIAMQFRLV